jgi:hypothetical protein
VKYQLTIHARESLAKRANIRLDWLERVLAHPQRTLADPVDPALEHRLGRIDEYQGRVLRVIVNPGVDPLRVITVFFDRGQRGRV